MSALTIEHLSVYYDRMVALWDISLEIPDKKLVALVGPNGAGKSTLIKACLGLIPISQGNILFFNNSLKSKKNKIAYVPQKESVDWNFPITVEDLVLMGAFNRSKWFKSYTKEQHAICDSILDKLGLLSLKNREIGELSGGQQQRCFIARALMQDADIYFLDEPFNGIDHATEDLLSNIFKELQKRGKTVIVVQHNLKNIENRFDWIVLINRQVVASGPIETTFTKKLLEKTYGTQLDLLETALSTQKSVEQGW